MNCLFNDARRDKVRVKHQTARHNLYSTIRCKLVLYLAMDAQQRDKERLQQLISRA